MTTQKNTLEFITDFENISESLKDKKVPKWLNSLRTESLDRFTKIGVPTVKNEEWKYTNILPVVDQKYSISKNNTLKEIDDYNKYCTDSEIKVVFVNGVFSDELSNIDKLDSNITIQTLENALEQNENEILKFIEKYKTDQTCTFASLNSALTDNGVFVKVNKGSVIEQLIHIVHVTSATNGENVSFPRSFITLGESSEATILESHVSFSDEITYFSNALTDI